MIVGGLYFLIDGFFAEDISAGAILLNTLQQFVGAFLLFVGLLFLYNVFAIPANKKKPKNQQDNDD